MELISLLLGVSILIAEVLGQASYRPGGTGSQGSSSGGSSGIGGSGAFGGANNGASSGGGRPGGFNGNAGGSGGFGGSNDAGFGGGNGGGSLEEAIPGVPGDDYPILAAVPDTSFVCDGQVDGGYYADPESECQAFHICANDGNGGLTKYSFLCPNGTLFQQQYFVCEWWFNVDCSLAEQFYSLNEEISAERAANSPAGGGDYSQAGSLAGGRGGQGGNRGGQTSGSRGSQAGGNRGEQGGQTGVRSPTGIKGGYNGRQGSNGRGSINVQANRGSGAGAASVGSGSRGVSAGNARGGANGSSRGSSRGSSSGGRRGGPSVSATGSQSSYLAPVGVQNQGSSQSGFDEGPGFSGDINGIIAADTGYGAPPAGSGSGAGVGFEEASDGFPSYNRNTRDLDVSTEMKEMKESSKEDTM